MIDTKPNPKVTSILNDLKMRRQKLLFHSKTIKENEICQPVSLQKFSFDQTGFDSNVQNKIQREKIQQKYLVFHIDNTFFQDQTQQKQMEQFLKDFAIQNDLIQLIQIKLALILNPQRQLGTFSMTNEYLETKMLKLNLKYALNSRNKTQKAIKLGSQNIYHIFILSSSLHSLSFEQQNKKCGFLFNEIDWTDNPWILIVKNPFSIQQINKKRGQNIYQILYESFLSYQNLFKNKNQKIPPIIILQNLNCILKEGIFKKYDGQERFSQLSLMQHNLFKVQKNIKTSQSIQHLQKQIFSKYLSKIFIKKSITQLAKFMKFYKRRQQQIYKKYFNIWSIITSEASIKKIQTEIIEKKYFQEKHYQQIKQKSFNHWKIFCQKKKQMYY